MLQYQAIDPSTLDLLKKLQSLNEFRMMRLAGGTALALQYGHRKSVDIDLFGEVDFDSVSASSLGSLGEVKILQNLRQLKSYLIKGIKVDIVHYAYPWISPQLTVDNLRLASDKDIGAMKLAAITGRGVKKYFFDLYFLLKHYSLAELLGFFSQKFLDGSPFLVLKSLVYFEGAEGDVDPVQLIPITWEEVKNSIVFHHTLYLDSLA